MPRKCPVLKWEGGSIGTLKEKCQSREVNEHGGVGNGEECPLGSQTGNESELVV